MVFVYNLDGRMRDIDIHHDYAKRPDGYTYLPTPAESLSGHEEEARANVNINNFSAALACYPIVSALAANLDLNSLHNLSRTCRQFRGTLLLYRDQLVSRTLQCSVEARLLSESETPSSKFDTAAAEDTRRLTNPSTQRLTSGKVSKCARDLVRDCRNCGTIICRNCTAKPSPSYALKGRCRRLCATCLRAPLDIHLEPLQGNPSQPGRNRHRLSRDEAWDSSSDLSRSFSNKPERSRRFTSSSTASFAEMTTPSPSSRRLTDLVFKRTPCTCDIYNHLCVPCGAELIAHDRDYERGWIWRNKYSAYVGVAEGNKGVECGRRAGCLAARFVEQESDCAPDTFVAAQQQQHHHRNADDELSLLSSSLSSMSSTPTRLGRTWEGGSFVMQEHEGIGGVVKMKVKKLVLVGAEVDGLEDEVSDDEYRSGSSNNGNSSSSSSSSRKSEKKDLFKGERTWCAWCERVVPGLSDVWDRAWDIGGDSK